MKPIFVDYENSVISISSAFKKKAFTPGTCEYRELNKVRRDFPEFEIEVRKFKTNTNQDRYGGLTYNFMYWYIETYEDKKEVPVMKKALDYMIDVMKCHSKGKRYPAVKSWFLETYPEVKEMGLTDELLSRFREECSCNDDTTDEFAA